MTKQQMAWAQQHDWFVNATIKPRAPIDPEYATVIVREYPTEGPVQFHEFDDFQALRAWAGY